jgi:hypothetical protein
VAILTYAGLRYEIPYSLINWMAGWIAVGAKGSHAPLDAEQAIRAALSEIESAMKRSALNQ